MAGGTGEAKRPQVTALIEDELERDVAVDLARVKKERDLLGRGLSVVMRRAVRSYVRANLSKHRHELKPELQARLKAAGR